jgi:hypothetical protein
MVWHKGRGIRLTFTSNCVILCFIMSQGRPKLPRPYSTCHPDIPAFTSKGGLCRRCYCREWAKIKRSLNPVAPKPIQIRFSTCHPERRHWGRGLCSVCYHQAYRSKNPEVNKRASAKWREANKDKRWAKHIRYRYGMSVEDYNLMLKQQQNSCKLCGRNPILYPVIEHSHTTEKVRGIVCQRCNNAISLFEGYADLMDKIPEYLRV